MKASSMYLLKLAADTIKPQLHTITATTSTKEASIILNNTLRITLTPAELEGFKETDNMLLFLLRTLGIRINLQVQEIDWWYYNLYRCYKTAEKEA